MIPQTNYVHTSQPVPLQPVGAEGDAYGFIPQSIFGPVRLAGAAAGAYHGYKRNNSIGWAIGWSLLGALAPIITVPISLAQGFGKKK